MIRTGLRGWLVVRQGLTRRIYGAADAGLVISFATYPFAVPAEEGGGFMQLRWFQVRSTDDPGCVYHPSELSGKSEGTDVSRRLSSNIAVTCA